MKCKTALVTIVALLSVILARPNSLRAQGPVFFWPLSGSADGQSLLDRNNSPFGPRIRASDQVFEFHEGIDLAGPAGGEVVIGTPVLAAAEGTVSLLTDDAGCVIRVANATALPGCTPLYAGGGRIVRLVHGPNLYTLYFHLSRQADGLTTIPGSETPVVALQQIGEVGMTGRAALPHLHFEVRDGSTNRLDAKNALGYLPRTVSQAPVISTISVLTVDGTAEVSATIESASGSCDLAPDCDLDLNQIVLRIRDAAGMPAGEERRVAFNERVNTSPNIPEVNGILLDPAPFNRFSLSYRMGVVFKAAPVVPGGVYEVEATKVSGLSAIAQATLP